MSEEIKSETDNIQEQSNEDFDVIFVSKADDGTVVAPTPLSIRDQKLQLALSQYDPENKKYSVYLNEGIVVKSHAGQKYTSDAMSIAVFRGICEEAQGVVTRKQNRTDRPSSQVQPCVTYSRR